MWEKHVSKSLLSLLFASLIDCDIVHQVTQEHFRLVIIFDNKSIHEEYHACFLNKSKEWGIAKTHPDKQLNIMVVLIDSLSRSHTQRSLKNTYKFLSEHPRTVIMKVGNFSKLYNGDKIPVSGPVKVGPNKSGTLFNIN